MLSFPVILSGGIGSRLWPMSRGQLPKQLLSFTGDNTLLQDTVLRTRADGKRMSSPIIVCNEEHRFLVAEQLREIGIDEPRLILEPVGRNTAPAVTLAALDIVNRHGDGAMLIAPADHRIPEREAFHAAVTRGREAVENGAIVAFGVIPTRPETGYGYIKVGEGNRIAEFVEKPDAVTARAYLESGDYLWNAGIFYVRAEVWLRQMRDHAGDILQACERAYRQGSGDGIFFRADKDAFANVRGESIDYAVMEHTRDGFAYPLDCDWSDLGSWESLWEISERDDEENVRRGDVLPIDTRNSMLISQHRLLAVLGLRDIVVVETPDAVLVADRAKTQDIKKIVEQLRRDGRPEHSRHRRVYRPWGYYECIDGGERFQVKRLIVKPGEAISLQMHRHRAEHWVVVNGTARVTRGQELLTLRSNESVYIPPETRHRLENPGSENLEIIEVQSGDYLGEDDIERYEDKYRRDGL